MIAAAAVVLAALSAYTLSSRKGGCVAVISQYGETVREIDLSLVAKEYSFTVEAPNGGVNRVLVQPGRICVEEADCPDQICEQQGWLPDGAMPIVCMPHGLVIEIRDAGASADAVSG